MANSLARHDSHALGVRLRRARHTLSHPLWHAAVALGAHRIGDSAARMHVSRVLVQKIPLLADKKASGHLASMPDDIDVVPVCLVLLQIAGRFCLVHTARLVARVPTQVDAVKFSLVLAHTVYALSLIRARRPIGQELGTRVPHEVDAMDIALVAFQQGAVGRDVGAAGARKLSLGLGVARRKRRHSLRCVAVGKVLCHEFEIVECRDVFACAFEGWHLAGF